MNESNEVLRTQWNELIQNDCFKNYQRQAGAVSAGGSTKYSTCHKWCWAENVQVLESCGYKCTKSPRFSSVSLHECSLDSELPPPIQLVSTTSIPTTKSLKIEINYLESSEILVKDSVLESSLPSSTQTSLVMQSPALLEPSHQRRSSSTNRSYINSADDGDRLHLKHAKRGKPSDAIDLLFKSYAETFKSFPVKKQVLLKVKLAKLFADAELDEMEEPSVVSSSASVADEHDYTLGFIETMKLSPDSDISSID